MPRRHVRNRIIWKVDRNREKRSLKILDIHDKTKWRKIITARIAHLTH